MFLRRFCLSILFITLILACTGSVQSQDRKSCYQCEKPIEGAYIQAERHFFHPDHLICVNCDDPIKGELYYYHRGKFYDSDCYEKMTSIFCDFCSDKIESEYINHQKKRYHSACFDQHVAVKCMLCSQSIRGAYIEDDWGNDFHIEHEGVSPQCNYCRTFVTNSGLRGGFQYEDGRNICYRCNSSSVIAIDEATRLAREISGHLNEYGFFIPKSLISIKLLDADSLALVDSSNHRRLGLTDYKASKDSWGRTVDREVTIYILWGLPRAWAVSTISHELMHVWQILNGQPDIDPTINEGSCNYASLLVLQNFGGEEYERQTERLLNDQTPIYGDGLRQIKKLVDTEGIPAWVELLTSE